MTLLQLQYFDTVCQAGTVSGAAGMLHIAQPSLSVALKNLEEELGLELFARRGRGLELTAAGSLAERTGQKQAETELCGCGGGSGAGLDPEDSAEGRAKAASGGYAERFDRGNSERSEGRTL